MISASVLETDVAVIGSGPAGIAAATRAAEAGRRATIIDSAMRPGGQIWRHVDPAKLPATARSWIERSHRAGVHWLLQATVVDGSPSRGLVVVASDGTRIVHASRVIIATGARELFLPYPGWTLPNAMGAGGAQALLKGGLEVRGKRVVVAGSGPLLLPVAAAFAQAGARVDHVAEQASVTALARFMMSLLTQPVKLALAARYRATIPIGSYRLGTWVARADGDNRVESVTLTDGRQSRSVPCDLLCCSYGLVPSVELARLFGCAVVDGKVVVDSFQRTTVTGVYSAGESTGVAGDEASIAEGEIAGITAATGDGARISATLRRRRDRGRDFQHTLAAAFRLRPEVRNLADARTVICRCEDVRLGRLDPAWTARQAKLYTRIGMGPCQGAVCGPAVQHLFGWPAGSVRPPLFAPAIEAWMATSDSPTATLDQMPQS